MNIDFIYELINDIINQIFYGGIKLYNSVMKKKARTYLNIFLAAIIIYLWLRMCFGYSGQSFMRGGFRNLKYFTILSNLLEAIACIVFVLKGNEKLKYTAAVSVMLTFTVVVVFLGHVYGYKMMFSGPSLWFHGLVPVIAMMEFIICNKTPMTKRDNLFAVVPLVLYGIGYLGNILINGIVKNDWYHFMSWGYGVGFVIFAVIIITVYLIGLVLRKLNEKVAK